MYKIIGVDDEEYGPVTEGQIRQWVAEGRADANTRANREGEVEWQPLGKMPEFAAHFQVSGPWVCPKCTERIQAQFDTCWQCSTRRPGLAVSTTAPSQATPPKLTPKPVKTDWRVKHRMFRAGMMTGWDELFDQAADFATEIGRERLIGISHSSDHSDGVVTVWYWSQGSKWE